MANVVGGILVTCEYLILWVWAWLWIWVLWQIQAMVPSGGISKHDWGQRFHHELKVFLYFQSKPIHTIWIIVIWSFSLHHNRCCRRNCMPDSKCSENVEGCLTAEDCNAGRPHSYFCVQLSKKMCKNQLLKVNAALQVLSAIVLLHVPTAWTLMSAQVIFHFNMSTKY